MARIPRLLNTGEATVYHVMSRTALDGFPLGDVEKDYLLELIKGFSGLYLVEIMGFALMGNHFHLLARVLPEGDFSDEEIRGRLKGFYGDKKHLTDGELLKYREKLGSLSEFVREVKQSFTRYFNKERKRFGFFWGQRFKSVIVEDGETLINCLAYIDLNPVRAGLVKQPEDYRWNTMGYLQQRKKEDPFLSLNFGLAHEEKLTFAQRIEKYRQFVYEVGSLPSNKGKAIEPEVLDAQQKKGFQITPMDRFRQRTRYFTDSGVIGSKQFVSRQYQRFEDFFDSKKEKRPVPIQGLEGCYSLKRLSMNGGPL
ncbi:transposase [Deltaproteobacteria bacterium TL4]